WLQGSATIAAHPCTSRAEAARGPHPWRHSVEHRQSWLCGETDAMKVCRKCGEEKPLTEFHRDSRARDGLYWYCKPCAIARACAWQKANPEKVNEKNRRWRETNKDRVRATRAEWRRKNLEKVRKASRDWARKKRQNNSEGVLEYQRR